MYITKDKTISFNPGLSGEKNTGQLGFFNDWRHFLVALEGGWSSGKTFAGARKLRNLHVYNSYDSEGNLTGVPSAIIAPTLGNASDYDIPEMKRALAEADIKFELKMNGSIDGEYAAPVFLLPELSTNDSPSVIIVRTGDDPGKITGWQVGALWGDEAARWKQSYDDPMQDVFMQAIGRVRHPRAKLCQAMLTYTNEGDGTRIFDEMSKGLSDRALYRASTKSNPTMADFYERQKLLLPLALQKQYLDGEAVNLRQGKVYGNYNSAMIRDDLVYDRNLPVQVAIDFNINPGMHAEIGQFYPATQEITTLYEIHGPGMNVIQATIEIADWYKKNNATGPIQIYGDVSGNARSVTDGKTSYQVMFNYLDQAGISYVLCCGTKAPAISDRVNAVNNIMLDVNSKTRYFISRKCAKLLDDYKKLKYTNKGEIDKSNSELSHASDADGYRIVKLCPIRRIEMPDSRLMRFSV